MSSLEVTCRNDVRGWLIHDDIERHLARRVFPGVVRRWTVLCGNGIVKGSGMVIADVGHGGGSGNSNSIIGATGLV